MKLDLAHYADFNAETGCWLFRGYRTKKGYGKLTWGGTTWQAHRAFYTSHVGVIPDSLMVCHRCDVRNCVNPEHLFLGTNNDNMQDMVAKGRQAKGSDLGGKISGAIAGSSKHSSKTGTWKGTLKARTGEAGANCRFSDAEVKRICEEYRNGKDSQAVVASRNGCSEGSLYLWLKHGRLPASVKDV